MNPIHSPIHLRNNPSSPQAFDHTEFLVYMAKWIKPISYLELGIWGGQNFYAVSKHCKLATGVDHVITNYREPKSDNINLIEKTTDKYFEDLSADTYFDMIFIDAWHSKESVIKDFTNASKHIMDDGFIFLHDSYPCDKSLTVATLCNDCWAAVLSMKNDFIDDFEIVTLPFSPGLTICKKMKRNKQLLTEGITQ